MYAPPAPPEPPPDSALKSYIVNASARALCFLTNDSLGYSLKIIYEIGLGFGTVRGMSAILGRVLEESVMLTIGDLERRSGLYILGKPRMGKSWLIVNLILQDIKNGHGVFFIDPHGSAIDDILLRAMEFKRTILFDPESEHYSFGINPLRCGDLENPRARAAAFNLTKGFFDKLWKSTFEEKPWLQLILQSTIYAFIENQGYTLADFPLFFRDEEFRYFLISKMQHNRHVLEYWLFTFVKKSKRDQDMQMEAAQTRAEIMLAHPYVSDIVGQSKTTIDFEKMMETKKIVLFSLSTQLSYESKKIIGTPLVSQLLHAVQKRVNSQQFCIYIDEFQNFASFDDFSTLITQAPKFGIATTVCHHERYGQLMEEPGIIGATAAIANKVLFQITVRDAQELAPEFAEKPPVETRFEYQSVISKNPFWDLLCGHNNPEVCKFIEKYLRPIKARLEDILGETRTESLMRMEYLDESNLLRLDERLEAANIRAADSNARRGLSYSAGKSIESAIAETREMQKLNEEAQMLRQLIRSLNKCFIAVMGGNISPISDDFRKVLFEQTKYMNLIDILEPVFQIHLLLKYGENRHNDLINAKNPDSRKRTGARYGFCKPHPGIFDDPVAGMDRALSQLNFDLQMRNIEEIAEITKNHCLNGFQMYAKPVPLERFPYIERWEALQQNLETLVTPLIDLKEACSLLQRPEDYMRVQSKQQIEKKVPLRTEADMAGEVVRKLTELSKYTAYGSVFQGRDKWKGEIKTLELKETPYGEVNPNVVREMFTDFSYCRLRILIAREMKERQEKWKNGSSDEPPPQEA